MQLRRWLNARSLIVRGAMHHGCVAGANEGGRDAAGWWPTSPSCRWAERSITPASWPPTTKRTCPATASPQARGSGSRTTFSTISRALGRQVGEATPRSGRSVCGATLPPLQIAPAQLLKPAAVLRLGGLLLCLLDELLAPRAAREVLDALGD